jgi:hypothetical protein
MPRLGGLKGIWACPWRVRVCQCASNYDYDIKKNLRLLIAWTGTVVAGHVQDVEARVEQHEQDAHIT